MNDASFSISKLVEDYFRDSSVNELCVNGTRSLCLFHEHGVQTHSSPFTKEAQWIRLCQEFALNQGQRLDAYSPSAGGLWEGGQYRWHSLIPPASGEGAILCVRRHRFDAVDIEDFPIRASLSRDLEVLFKNPSNHILICGPTGSGKTTLLHAFLKRYAMKERVILIEEYAELPLLSPLWLRLVSRGKDIEGRGELKLSYLIEESLRLRPDRMVLGEIRNVEALAFFESVLLGHHGSVSTLHASQSQGVSQRIHALLTMRGVNPDSFLTCLGKIKNLWYVFVERGSPPSIVGIEKSS